MKISTKLEYFFKESQAQKHFNQFNQSTKRNTWFYMQMNKFLTTFSHTEREVLEPVYDPQNITTHRNSYSVHFVSLSVNMREYNLRTSQ